VELPLRALFEGPTVAELAVRVEETRRADLPVLPPVVPVDRDRPLPLSFAQERLWFLDRMEPGSPVYNVAALFRLEGDLPAGALERGLTAVVGRHEALRTRFAEVDGEPVQVVEEPPRPWRLSTLDLAGLPLLARAAELPRLAAAEAWRPFDLAAGPLLRTLLLEAGESGRALLVATHHIVSDAWSIEVLVRELSAVLGAPDPARPGHRTRSREDTERWIAWNQDNYRTYGFGLWALETHDGRFVGDCGLTMQDVEGELHLEVGYHVAPELREVHAQVDGEQRLADAAATATHDDDAPRTRAARAALEGGVAISNSKPVFA